MSDTDGTALGWRWPRWLEIVTAIYLLIGTAFALEISIHVLLAGSGVIQPAESLGFEFRFTDKSPPGWREVTSVTPDRVMAASGIRTGDLLRFDSPFSDSMFQKVGDRIGLTIQHDGIQSHHELSVRPAKIRTLSRLRLLTFGIVYLFVLAVALFVILRRWGNPMALSLGLLLFSVAYPGGFSSLIQSDVIYTLGALSAGVANSFICMIIPLALFLVEDAATPRQFTIAKVVTPICGLGFGGAMALCFLLGETPLTAFLKVVAIVPGLAPFVIAIWLLYFNFRKTSPSQRNRIKIMGLAFAIYMLAAVVASLDVLGLAPGRPYYPEVWANLLLILLSVSLVAYAIVRQGLFDFSFAVNRTLVYGAVSLVLLCGFGLAEWAVDHLVPEEWHKAGPIYSAGIALVLFLTFHRVRDFVEHRVERLFFRKWHANERQLREFVHRGAHFERGEGLAEAAIAELNRFSGGADAAFYWGETDEAYSCIAASGVGQPDSVDVDDHALVAARASPGAVDVPATGSALTATLLLPVRDHGALAGFLTLGAKPQSLGYRPDEVELLEWAAQQIGLSLQSARAKAMRSRTTALELRVKELESLLDRIAPTRRSKAAAT